MELADFKNLILPFSPKLLRFASLLLANPEDARDVVQDVFLKLWLMRDKMDSYRSPEAYSMTMVKNACLDHLRKRKNFVEHNEGFGLQNEESEDTDKMIDNRDTYKSVIEMLDQLPEQQKAIIHLKDVEGYSTEEVMEIMGISANTLRVNLSRARSRLRELILQKNSIKWNANN